MRIHLLGDSLVQTRQASHGKFYRGWGDMLSAFLCQDTEIVNYAMGGRSSRSFLNEGRFYDNGQFTTKKQPFGVGPALDKIEKGDYVFIQFMCNDDDSSGVAYRINKKVLLGNANENGIYPTVVPHKDMLSETKNWNDGFYEEALFAEGYSEKDIATIVKTTEELIAMCGETFFSYDAGATYKGYLKFYIDHIRQRGAFPILVISGAKLIFTDEKIKPLPGYYGGKDSYCDFPYVEAQKQLGKELSVPLVDLFSTEKTIYEKLGREKASLFHNISIDPGDVKKIDDLSFLKQNETVGEWIFDFDKRHAEHNYISVDSVHKNHFGAFFQAALIADDLLKKGILKDKIQTKATFFPGLPKGLKTEKEVFSTFEFIHPF